MGKFSRIIKVGAILLIIGVVAQIWVVNNLSVYGDKLAELERKKAKLELENQLLKNEIATYGAISKVEEQAKSVGFEAIKQVEYIQE